MVLLLLTQLMLQPKVVNQPLPGNYWDRDTTVNYVVIHYDGVGGYRAARNTLIKRKLGYHYYIRKNGTIVKLIEPTQQAPHAGVSYYDGVFLLNRKSIGICLENNGREAYTDAQYKSLSWLIKTLQTRFDKTTFKSIVGHSDVALPRGRKSDPGRHFSWKRLHGLVDFSGAVGRDDGGKLGSLLVTTLTTLAKD